MKTEKGNDNIPRDSYESELSFALIVQRIRRKYMMEALLSKDPNKKARG